MEKSPSPTKARPTRFAMIRGIPRNVQREHKKFLWNSQSAAAWQSSMPPPMEQKTPITH
jgi:hypothetical protein